ncbi:PAS domain-containing protein [Thalassotalea sp. M1531]|uniref:Sensory/regulatory protein RpfC n=1 Tax=Thalassotalea algicola TaxID=2716224 RepID=A0A7Y0L9Z2_9GAMM|nr:PAS domain-containing protein [Thalassotalea algicola]NMP30207.1 PAS domain-containing protein [Thalassotalea algicola]
MFNTESLIAGYSKRYTLALLAIGVLVLSAYFALNHQYSYQQLNANIINVAGEQRMLSQKVSLLSTALLTENHQGLSESEVKKRLQLAANKMSKNQALLVKQLENFEPSAAEKINEKYFGLGALNQRVKLYTDTAQLLAQDKRTSLRDQDMFFSIHTEQILADLDEVVSLFEQGANQQIVIIKNIALFTLVITLFSLVLIAFVVFKPMKGWLITTYDKLAKERDRVADFQFAINKHSIVIQIDSDRNLVFYNKKFRQVYGYKKGEILGQKLDLLKSSVHEKSFYQTIANTLADKQVWRGESCNKAKNGRLHWFTTTIVPLKNSESNKDNFIIIQNDITEQKLTEIALKQLHDVSADPNIPLDEKINRLLAFGCELFHLPIGLVSEIRGENYSVLHACTPNNEVSAGDNFELGNTYCCHTLAADGPIAYDHAGESNIANHPCYQGFGLESYIGTPLIVDGKRFGTLNFSSPDAYPRPFTDSDLELIQLIAQWIGYEFMRKQQREMLVGQRQLMEQMSQLAKIGAWEVDLITGKVTWSSMTKQIHEVPEDYCPQLDTAINFYKEGYNRERISKLVEESIATGLAYHEELELVTAKGNAIWVAAKGEAEFKDGECVRLFGSFQDITERVNSQKKLAESNDRLAFVMQSTGVGIWDWEIETGKTVFNERWANIVGYSLNELQPVNIDTWMSLAHPDDLAHSEQQLNRHWQGETENYTCESRMRHKSGHWVWVLDTGKVVEWHDDGRPKRMIGTHLDISESKQAETEIEDKNRRMALAADSAGIGVWDLNVITNELSWDDWMFRLYGVEPDKFSGAYEAWENGLHPDDKEQSVKLLQQAINNTSKFDTQFRIIWPNGEVRYIKASAINKQDDQGRVTNMIGVNYDVTDRVENEIALTTAKFEAEAAAKAKNEFLASMSHEIRTPMNGVIGMLELLDDSELNKEQHHRVSIAQSSAHSLLHLINDILDFSKIDADKLNLETIPFDLRKMMGELAESLATQAQSKGLELILDTVGLSDAFVEGDPSRIRQILTNLISNSIKFTHHGEVVITAMLIPEDESHWRLKLKVKDTGIGIAKDKQSLLFESFSQVDSSTTRHYGGTGLGLAIVKKLCQRMAGDVTVISDVGEGSQFVCDIRVGKTAQLPSQMPKVDISTLNILVADDNATNCEVLVKQLTNWGANVIKANNGQDALELCKESIAKGRVIDIGILDMQMPNMDGEQLAANLKQVPQLANIKLIMMTSMQTKGDAKRYAKMGFSGYFPKPATTSDLLAALHIIADDGQALERANPLVTHHYINEINESSYAEGSSVSQIVKNAETIDNSQLKVLLVEDNRINQMVAKGVLNKIGLNCDIASNGIEALSQLSNAQQCYDLVLMDIQMPEMDGYEATKGIRAGDGGKQHKDMIIIAMTANAMAGDREKCIAAGMNDYLAKPINKDKLELTIKSYF